MITLIFENSRYQFRLLKRDGSVLRIPAFKGIKNTNFPDNITIRLKNSDRLDILSFQLYGTTRFDWLLADFNNIKFPISDLKTLDTIKAPSKQTLYSTIIPSLSQDAGNTP